MTCIVGIVDPSNNAVWLAGDSAVSGNDGTRDVYTSKVFRARHYSNKVKIVVGMCGSLRLMQLIEHTVLPQIEETPHYMVTDLWLVTEFFDLVRKAYTDRNAIDPAQPHHTPDTQILIGIGGELFMIDDRFEVCRALNRYDAIGSGRHVALGSLFATANIDMQPKSRLYHALAAASHHMENIVPPYYAYNTNDLQPIDLNTIFGGQ